MSFSLEVQRTIKRAEKLAFYMALRKLCVPEEISLIVEERYGLRDIPTRKLTSKPRLESSLLVVRWLNDLPGVCGDPIRIHLSR